MKKHWWIALILVLVLAVPAVASQAIKIYVDGKEIKTDVPAHISDGRTMVPLRAIAESFGKTVDWDNNTKTVTITGKSDAEKVTAIASQLATSTKNTYIESPVSRGANCAKCHEGNTFSTGTYDEKHISGFTCATCHTGNGQKLMDQGFVGKINVDYAWLNDYKGGTGALCMSCHNSNRNPEAEFAKQTEDGKRTALSYPHYKGNAALFTGKGGMEVPGVTYAKSFAHPNLENTCVSCHMPKNEDGFMDHTFKLDASKAQQVCGTCHSGATSFDVNGYQTALYDKLKKLEKAILAETGATSLSSGSGSLQFLDADGKAMPANKISQKAYVAYYNLKLVKAEGSMGVHNPKYAKSLIEESYKYLTGKEME